MPAEHTTRTADVGDGDEPRDAELLAAGVRVEDSDADEPADGDVLAGWALPPAHNSGVGQALQVPSAPTQYELPICSDA